MLEVFISLYLIFVLPQVINTYFMENLWKTFFLGYIYANNMSRNDRKFHLKRINKIALIIFVIGMYIVSAV